MLKWMRERAFIVEVLCSVFMAVVSWQSMAGNPSRQELSDEVIAPQVAEDGPRERARPRVPPPPPQRDVRRAVAPIFPTPDPRVADLGAAIDHEDMIGQLYMVTQDYTWGLGQVGTTPDELKDPQIFFHGHPVNRHAFGHFILSLTPLMSHATDLIAVGMASCRGNTIDELDRGAARAATLAGYIRGAYPPPPESGDRLKINVWTLNLGKFNCSSSIEDRPEQRRLVILALKRRDGICLGSQDLEDAMRAFGVLRLDVRDYQTFDLHSGLIDDACAPVLTADL